MSRPRWGWGLGTDALKQGSDIRFDVGAWGLGERCHWWIIQMMNQNVRTRCRGGC